ncbi:hypothetical protein NVS89_22625 [Ancylobacter sp. MQZ15Z-1]|uniref:Uncharacterized protein n=1 Tax=Ancylobacter mangrovi TaxID=2972472 RepID=A0A9X2PH94_9HYPH|nr:hypothetical protein [Ancylobacter mangrovi]MCS0497890.1 hypothetical protein [Ancylobacter mangrovi]
MTKRRQPGSAHEALDRMFDGIGERHGEKGSPTEGVRVVASFLDIAEPTLRKQLDPDQKGSEVSYARVAQLTRHFACIEAAQHLALCAGGVFLPLPDGEGKFAELSSTMMQEVGEALVQLSASLSPTSEGGASLTPREIATVLPLVADVLAVTSALYSELQAAHAAREDASDEVPPNVRRLRE